MSSRELLHNHIVSLSEANTWDSARSEWELASIYNAETPQSCPCGQYPIIEICVIQNKKNGNTAEVGNKCVNNFLNLPSERLFASIRIVKKDAGRSFSESMIDYAFQKKIINEWEWKFYHNIRLKRSLSGRQKEKKEQINAKILRSLAR